jgi:Helix-turn-helix of DDE superfamily endonuclease/DDE superfamily endonuclease
MAEPLVVEAVDQNNTQYQGLQLLFYRAALPLSSRTLSFVAGVIRRHRKSAGSRWRKLSPGRQALLVLAYLKKGETFAEVAAGFGVGTATAWRYVNETVDLLAARAPKLCKAVRDAEKAGHAYVILDGTLIPIDRVARDRPFYSGKHKKHGMNLQVIASPGGDILWVSGALPGSVHDKKAEWIWGVLDELEKAGLVTLADIRDTRAAPGRRSLTGARASPNPRRKPTAPTRNSADPASARTPSSSHGGFSASSAAAHGAPGNSPRQSTYCRPAKPNQVGISSVTNLLQQG